MLHAIGRLKGGRLQFGLTRVRQDAASREAAKFEAKKQCLASRPRRGVGQGTFFTPLGDGSLRVLGSTLFFGECAAWMALGQWRGWRNVRPC